MIFKLEWVDYDSSNVAYFEADATLKEFNILCNILMREAAEDALEHKASSVFNQGHPKFIDQFYLFHEIVARLQERGYREIKLPSTRYEPAWLQGN
jgi:hypothetical protein